MMSVVRNARQFEPIRMPLTQQKVAKRLNTRALNPARIPTNRLVIGGRIRHRPQRPDKPFATRNLMT
jgi:hypothetical protein